VNTLELPCALKAAGVTDASMPSRTWLRGIVQRDLRSETDVKCYGAIFSDKRIYEDGVSHAGSWFPAARGTLTISLRTTVVARS
jgi:hypothetical protein